MVRRLYRGRGLHAPTAPAGSDSILSVDGVIQWVGPYADAPVADERFDLDGVLLPGLIDSHAHLTGLGMSLRQVDLSPSDSLEAALSLLSNDQGSGWLLSRGWDHHRWGLGRYPNCQDLDRITGNRPASITRVDGHCIWVNSEALRQAGISSTTEDPPGGRILRDEGGRPTGILIDEAMTLVRRMIPKPDANERRIRTLTAQRQCHRWGLTGMHDCGSQIATIAVWRQMEAAGELRLRIHSFLDGIVEDEDAILAAGCSESPFVKVHGVKLFADGALGSRGAWLLAPYCDAKDERGIQIVHGDELRRRVGVFGAAGFQLAVHAIGDAAARDVVDAFTAFLQPGNDRRFRMEHSQIVHPVDRERMAKYGIFAPVQPIHATSDMTWAEAMLGPQRMAYAYAWSDLIDQGIAVSLGSDFPVEDGCPLAGIHAACTRQNREGWPRGGWYPEQRLRPEQALLGYTHWAARAGFDEARFGRLEPGFAADLTLLDRSPLDVPIGSLAELKSQGVVVAGTLIDT